MRSLPCICACSVSPPWGRKVKCSALGSEKCLLGSPAETPSHCRNWQEAGSSSKSQVLFYLSESTSDLWRRTSQWDLPLRAACLPSHLFCRTPPAERVRSKVIRREIQHKFQLECEYSSFRQHCLTPLRHLGCCYLFIPSIARFSTFKCKVGLSFWNAEMLMNCTKHYLRTVFVQDYSFYWVKCFSVKMEGLFIYFFFFLSNNQ